MDFREPDAEGHRGTWLRRNVLCFTAAAPVADERAGEADSGTIELLYEHLRDEPRRQVQQGASLDDKAQRALAIGGTALGLSSITTIAGAGWFVAAPVIGALAAFLALVATVLLSTRPAPFAVTTDADATLEHFRDYDRQSVLEGLLETTARAYPVNDAINRQKACRLRLALTLLAAELTAIAAAIIAAALA